ncbi:hypothetical protein ACFFYR_39040 [Paraburkholderia dipogonis]|nr:hypothetical protein [Paraburkholderia dipogonis]
MKNVADGVKDISFELGGTNAAVHPDLSEQAKQKILGGNAPGFFNIN